ncbi:hypothetical protein [Lacticaseibacillus sharpeae]|uniref:hypothetical protein n=1 Tax=Lacticaseibacillus sharpeae TaxID=1626 RepID=UPI0006D05AC8|nr:hypothetical protein [Lacticaseibacillus sharpeae]
MRKVAFDTYETFSDAPETQLPAIFTNTSIGIKLDSEYAIKFLTDVEQDEDGTINLSWSDNPADGMALFSKKKVGQYAGLLQSYAISRGMSPKKAAKAIYLVPRKTGYRS